MLEKTRERRRSTQDNVNIMLEDSASLKVADDSVATVLTSPPYCTRIDYAISTAAELALLGVGTGEEFEKLRASLMGTATVPSHASPSVFWGETCLGFIDRLVAHPSKASKGYYYKSHCQYFESLYTSISEIARVLRPSGKCAMVVQNSYYKDILNDLPQVCIEMAEHCGLQLTRSQRFEVRSSFSPNKRARHYVDADRQEYEEVLIFQAT